MRGRRIYQKYNKDVISLQVTHWNTTEILFEFRYASLLLTFPFQTSLPWLSMAPAKKKADMTMSLKFNQLCNWIMIILKWYCQVQPDDSAVLLSALRSSFWFSELLEFFCCDLTDWPLSCTCLNYVDSFFSVLCALSSNICGSCREAVRTGGMGFWADGLPSVTSGSSDGIRGPSFNSVSWTSRLWACWICNSSYFPHKTH